MKQLGQITLEVTTNKNFLFMGTVDNSTYIWMNMLHMKVCKMWELPVVRNCVPGADKTWTF